MSRVVVTIASFVRTAHLRNLFLTNSQVDWCCSILSVSITCLCECESGNDCDTFFSNSDKYILGSRLPRRFVSLLYLSDSELVYHLQSPSIINVCLVFLENSSVVRGPLSCGLNRTSIVIGLFYRKTRQTDFRTVHRLCSIM
jgi:hypothetical protein